MHGHFALHLRFALRGQKVPRGSVDPELPGGDVFSLRLVMRTKDFRSLDEKRAYYRLLRHLLSEKLQASYMEDQARPLPPRMVDLLKTLEHREPPETQHGVDQPKNK